VFPGDPYLAGWEKSRPYAEKLAARLGLDRVMPDVFDFPSGGMFWMRTALLQSLLPLYTGEDGAEHNDAENEETTLQSAFIRIIPNASQAAGLSQAVTHIPGVTL
jgi:lipopolysaccharide biosynthesis protein